MGCLCSSKVTFANKAITKSATFCSTRDFGDISFTVSQTYRNFHSYYKLQKDPIGSGLFGEIRLCTNYSTGKIYAVKVISKAGLSSDYIKKHSVELQVKMMEKIDHPSILKIFDFFEDACNYYLVMDFINGGDLFLKLEKSGVFSEKSAAKVMKQLFSALAHLHSNKIAHRDLKLENLMIEEVQTHIIIKVIDFDTAIFIEDGRKLKGVYGTVYYMAPELIEGEYDEKCDIWSAGVILYSLLTRNFPFGGIDEEEIMKAIVEGKLNYNLLTIRHCSRELISLIKNLLNPDPNKRISAAEALHHPWIEKFTKSKNIVRPLSSIISERQTPLIQALKLWAVKEIIPTKDLAEYLMIFIDIDKNSDGVVSKSEMIEFFGNEEHIEQLMEIADWNCNGVLEYHEFLSVVVSGESIMKYADQILQELDKDKCGKVSLSSLVSFLEYHLEGGLGLKCNDDNSQDISNIDILGMITI